MPRRLIREIPFLSINEIGYRNLGRGGPRVARPPSVAHPNKVVRHVYNDAARRVATSSEERENRY